MQFVSYLKQSRMSSRPLSAGSVAASAPLPEADPETAVDVPPSPVEVEVGNPMGMEGMVVVAGIVG